MRPLRSAQSTSLSASSHGLWALHRACRPAVLLLALLLPALASGEEPGPEGAALDAVERRLELGRHARLAAVKADPSSRLADFTTDGCSGGLSAGWEHLSSALDAFRDRHGERPPWEACCIAHDHLYHAGGPPDATPADSFQARRDADLALRACVIATGRERAPDLAAAYGLSPEEVATLYRAVADLMYRAVRLGGVPCTGLPWRWGYGWPECR